jgi:hypothetical protein
MGAMTDTFNRIYPLFMVIYTGLLASNVLDRVMGVFGSWRRFRNHDVEDAQGFDQSGLIILRKGVCNYAWFLLWVHAYIQETIHTVKL